MCNMMVLQHEKKREGREQLQQLWRAVDAAQQQRLDNEANHADAKRGNKYGRPEASPP